MKTTVIAWLVTCLPVITALSGETAFKPLPEKSYTGIVISIDPQEHTLGTQGAIRNEKFQLGTNCLYVLSNSHAGSLYDLRLGENVTVSYQNAAGVLVANRVEQHAMLFSGVVSEVDATNHSLTIYHHELDRTFEVPKNCEILLLDKKSGSFTNVQLGSHVEVAYEVPNDVAVAHQITMTSFSYTGTLKAIDLSLGTLKARTLFSSKNFKLAPHCAILLKGQPASLADLKLNEKLDFSYDKINGVNLVNRIIPSGEETKTVVFDEYTINF
jgi:hypothetical protein